MNVSSIYNLNPDLYTRPLSTEIFYDFSSDDRLLPGADVWFIGYPENRYDITHNLPILRKGHIASMPLIDYNAKKQFVIDAHVFPGSSGSPVFSAIGRQIVFIGVVTETMIKHQQLQSIQAKLSLGTQQVLGLGMVLKASLVRELINDAVTKAKSNRI